jgi:hypothetical protein
MIELGSPLRLIFRVLCSKDRRERSQLRNFTHPAFGLI